MKKGADNQQGVYIYQPPNAKPGKAHNERPSKRRKVESGKQEKQENGPRETQPCPFAPLLNGEESASSVELRYNTYQRLWSKQETKIQVRTETVFENPCKCVSDCGIGGIRRCRFQSSGKCAVFHQGVFVPDVSNVPIEGPLTNFSNKRNRYNGCIPSALVTVGSNVSSLGRLLTRLNERLTTTGEGGVIVLESGDAPNLKTTLKNIIRGAVTNTEGNDGYQSFLTDRDVGLPSPRTVASGTNFEHRDQDCLGMILNYSVTMCKGKGPRNWFWHSGTARLLTLIY